MKIIEGTEKLFTQDSKYVIKYLKSRKIRCLSYFSLLKHNKFGLISNVKFEADKIEYNVSHLLTCSKNSGYDIVKANNNLKMLKENEIAIAVVEGDDIIYYDNKSGLVYLWLVENGDGEKIEIAKTLSKFIKIFN